MEENISADPQEYLPLVKQIVDRFDIKLPSHWDREDMIGYGILGLLEAFERFQPEKGVKFSTFASKRIRGAILDALRKDTPLSRSCWKNVKKITDAIDKITRNTQGEFSMEAIATEVGMDKEEVEEALESLKLLSHISLEKTLGFTDNEEIKVGDKIKSSYLPEETVIKNQQIEELSIAVSKLKERQKLVLTLYYYEELTLKEIADIIDTSVSRVSQIKSMGLAALRKEIKADDY